MIVFLNNKSPAAVSEFIGLVCPDTKNVIVSKLKFV
jgi:hypothetical protein